ncbi:MAG TPA: acetate--CoA ligase family protein [Methylomirabilota bacterium]|nr:acetate--CoA ligase family protein [Methylomirabilota bacterium]
MTRLQQFLAPKSIAIAGCPGDLSRPGARPLVYLLRHGFPGAIYPVNPRHKEIGGLSAFPSLADCPSPPEMVWIGVPAAEVLGMLEQAAAVGARAAVILSAGFGETGVAGRAEQSRILDKARAAGMALLGPNTLGYVNCWDRVALTFSSVGDVPALLPGALGIASQSGALGGALLNRALDRRVGVSAMISTGNEADITVSEALEHFAEDERTRAVALVVEGIRDGGRFMAAARRLLEAGKPVVAMKLGRSRVGARNALTHTGALAGSTGAWDAVCAQLGIVQAATFEDLTDAGGFLARGPRLGGRRVAVVSSSGGAAIMTADELERRDFTLPKLSRSTVRTLAPLLPGYALTRDNPVDVTAGVPEERFGQALAAVAGDPRVDAIVVTVTMATGARATQRSEHVVRLAGETTKPIVVCWMAGSLADEGVRVLDDGGVSCFHSPRGAVFALDAAVRSAAARTRARKSGARVFRARRPLPAAAGPLPYRLAAALVASAGVRLPRAALVQTVHEAVAAAARMGFPVALKAMAPDLAHKTEANAVRLGLEDRRAVAQAARELLQILTGRKAEGLLVQKMVRGAEMMLGVTRDPVFGPLLLIGAGGIHAEVLADTACRPLPVTRKEVRAMLSEVKAVRLLRGHRGLPPGDLAALEDAALAVGRLALGLGERLGEMDLNPVVVPPKGHGVVAVDVLLVLNSDAKDVN